MTCLVLAVCKVPLEAAFCEKDGGYYCVEHYRELVSPKCTGCGKPIEGSVLSVGDAK